MTGLDIIVLILYLASIVIIGIMVARNRVKNVEGYFLANHSLKWPVIGAALFASNISTIHLVGLSASGFKDGLVWGNFEWMAVFILILLGIVFAPFYFKNRITTLPEFLEKRFNSTVRSVLAFLALLGALFMHIGVSLYAGAVIFEHFLGINVYVSILVISFLTALYTVIGGLHSVVITETIQTIVLVAGAITLTIFGIFALSEAGFQSWEQLELAAKPEQLKIIPGKENSSGLTWYDFLLGYPVIGIWYWCADQTIVQRVLGAKTLNDAKIGPLFAAALKILPVFVLVLPGIFAYILFEDLIQDPNDTYMVLIDQLLPQGLKGLMAAALLAALMSSVAAALNSAGTLVSIDIVKKIRPNTSDHQLVRIGKITSVIVMIAAILWSPLIAKFDSIFEAINVLLTVISPPISAVFVWGVIWRRGNHQGALATFIGGFLLGLLTFVLDFPLFGEQKLITDGLGISFLMQAWWLFVASSLIFFVTSLMTAAPDPEKIDGYTIESPLELIRIDKKHKNQKPLLFAGFLIIVMIVLYLSLS